MTEYLQREIEPFLDKALKSMPVVVLTGMRQVGKSTLLQKAQSLRNRKYITLDDFPVLEAARSNPEALIAGEKALTIDEAQRCPELLLAIKKEVDRDRKPGRFILSGSVNFNLLKGISETLAGRALYLTLHPFTQREIKGAIKEPPFMIQFASDLKLKQIKQRSTVDLKDILLGGLPPVCLHPKTDSGFWYKGYEQTYLERDIRKLSQVADLLVFRNLLKLAALRTGQILKVSEIGRDAKLNNVTASRYLDLLETSFVVRKLAPFLSNKATRLIKSPKLLFSDSGLAAFMTGMDHLDYKKPDPLLGPLLETYIAQNLSSILDSHSTSANLYYWHVQGRHEVDFVVELGREIIAIEVKAASRWETKDLSGLKAFLKYTPQSKAGFLAYNGKEVVKLEDKIWAVPIPVLLS
ncbi:ATP-binding protein [candidate division FCPU426 bacterium]|nr:ATP-binding protein [candidate division FCPU426 bacterium]